MDKITTDGRTGDARTSRVHILAERLDDQPDRTGKRLGKAVCGRTVRGWTGATELSGITCLACLSTYGPRGRNAPSN